MSSTISTSVAEKKAKLIEEKAKKNPVVIDRLKNFFKGLFHILIYLFILFFISPPLFYACQFINKAILSKKFTYEGYSNFEDYFENEIEFPTGKNRGATLPLNQRPLVPNIMEAFKAAVAQGYFTSYSVISNTLQMFGQLLDFNHTLESQLFNKNTPNSKIFSSLSKLLNERKPNGPVGKLFGSVMILFAPFIYLLLLIGFPLVSVFSGLFTLYTTLNLRTYIKLIVMMIAVLVAYASSYVTLFIPTVFFLFTPQIAVGGLLFFFSLFMFLVAIGIPSLSIFFSSLSTTVKALGSIFWLPDFVNSYFRDRMNASERERYSDVKLQGVRYEYPAHAREYGSLYSIVFLFMTLSLALQTAFA